MHRQTHRHSDRETTFALLRLLSELKKLFWKNVHPCIEADSSVIAASRQQRGLLVIEVEYSDVAEGGGEYFDGINWQIFKSLLF